MIDPEIVYSNWNELKKTLHFYEEDRIHNYDTNFHNENKTKIKNFNLDKNINKLRKTNNKNYTNELSIKDLLDILIIDSILKNRSKMSKILNISRITLNKSIFKAIHVHGFFNNNSIKDLDEKIRELYLTGEYNYNSIQKLLTKRGYKVSYYKVRKLLNEFRE